MNVKKKRKPHESSWYCGAKTKSGGNCKRRAGAGTDHVGEGRCKHHGGKTPIKTGRYSKISRPRIKELVEQFENDENKLDLLPEVLLLRALIQDYIERYDEYTEALLNWHQSFVNPKYEAYAKPEKVMDIISVGTFIKQIGSLVEKIHKAKEKQSVSMVDLHRVIGQLGEELVNAVLEVIPDADLGTRLIESVQNRWNSIRLEPGKAGSARD